MSPEFAFESQGAALLDNDDAIEFEERLEAEFEPQESCEQQLGATALCASCPLLRLLGDCPKILRGDSNPENEIITQQLSDSLDFEMEVFNDLPPIVVDEKLNDPTPIAIIDASLRADEVAREIIEVEPGTALNSRSESVVEATPVPTKIRFAKNITTAKQPITLDKKTVTKKLTVHEPVGVFQKPKQEDDYLLEEILKAQQAEKQVYYQKLLFDDSVGIVSVWQPQPVMDVLPVESTTSPVEIVTENDFNIAAEDEMNLPAPEVANGQNEELIVIDSGDAIHAIDDIESVAQTVSSLEITDTEVFTESETEYEYVEVEGEQEEALVETIVEIITSESPTHPSKVEINDSIDSEITAPLETETESELELNQQCTILNTIEIQRINDKKPTIIHNPETIVADETLADTTTVPFTQEYLQVLSIVPTKKITLASIIKLFGTMAVNQLVRFV